jgi:hypothetical protein
MQKLLQQIVNCYEDIDRYDHGNSLSTRYKDLNTETLEEVILDFQALYQYGDSGIDASAFIHSEDWLIFKHWEPCDQSEFLAYLSAKIAVARN